MSFVIRAVKAYREYEKKGWLAEHFKCTKEFADKLSRNIVIESAEKACLAAAYRMLANSLESTLDDGDKAMCDFIVSHVTGTTAEVHLLPFMKGDNDNEV